MKRLLLIPLLLVLSGIASADVIRIKSGSATADSCNDWYYTKGLNGGAHNPSANSGDLYCGFTGGFARRSARCFPGVNIGQAYIIDSAFMKSMWVTTDSTIKPVQIITGVKSDQYDTIVDSTRWVAAFAVKTTATDSMYDSLWARNTTAFTYARSWNVTTIMQELVNQGWWQLGDTAVFLAYPRTGTTGDRNLRALNTNAGGDSLIVFYHAPPASDTRRLGAVKRSN